MVSARDNSAEDSGDQVRTQSEQGHTPGPWSFAPAVPAAKRYFYISGNHAAHNREVDIGTVQGGYYSCEANARLIASAPDLLAALIGMADAYVALLLIKAEDPSRFKEPGSPYANALAAISKATGAQS